MSTNNEQPAVTLPPSDEAQDVFSDIVSQVFFAKLADHNIQPRDMSEAEQMLRIAQKAEAMASHPAVSGTKEAGLSALEQGLDKVAEQLGIGAGKNNQLLDQIALTFASNPAVYASALSLAQQSE